MAGTGAGRLLWGWGEARETGFPKGGAGRRARGGDDMAVRGTEWGPLHVLHELMLAPAGASWCQHQCWCLHQHYWFSRPLQEHS